MNDWCEMNHADIAYTAGGVRIESLGCSTSLGPKCKLRIIHSGSLVLLLETE